MNYTYIKADAFTSQKSSGNPAACLYLDEGESLSEEVMQSIAKEHKGFVSEVIYCTTNEDDSFSLRYYSSECEVDFCGHGTIACMYSLIRNTQDLHDKEEILIHTRKGTLPVYNALGTLDAVFITAPQPEYKSCAILAENIVRALKIAPSALNNEMPIELVNAGLDTLIVPLVTLDDVLDTSPNELQLKEFCFENHIDIILIFTGDVFNNASEYRTRVFAPKFGYLEDTATGSGNSAFGYYLLRHRMWKGESIAIEQNGERENHNMVQLKTREGKVLFGGRATMRIYGKYMLA